MAITVSLRLVSCDPLDLLHIIHMKEADDSHEMSSFIFSGKKKKDGGGGGGLDCIMLQFCLTF